MRDNRIVRPANITKDMPVKDVMSKNEIMINGCIFEIDENTGKTVAIKRVHID